MDWEDYFTNDTASGGACLTPADLEEQAERDRLVAASRAVRAGTDMLFSALRKNGVL